MNEEQEKQIRIDAAVQVLQAQLGWATQQAMNMSGELAVVKVKLEEFTKPKENPDAKQSE